MRGFILIYTLFILMLLSLMTLMLLHDVTGRVNMINTHIWHDEMVNGSSYLLQTVEQKLPAHGGCLIQNQTSQQMAHKPLSFWRRYACQVKHAYIHYFFVIELLARDPCARIGERSAMFFRITLLAFHHKLPGRHMMLARIVAVKDPVFVTCPQKRHNVQAGRQSERQLLWMG